MLVYQLMEENENSIANDIYDPCNKDKHTGYMYHKGIKIVYWNCQGANRKLAVIIDAIQKDGIHILLLQDTRHARRNDGLPKLDWIVTQRTTHQNLKILMEC